MIEENLPGDGHAEGPHRCLQDRRLGSGAQVAGREHVGGHPLHQTPEGHELTKRDYPDLVVPVGNRAVRLDGCLVVEVDRWVVIGSMEPSGHQHGIQTGCLGGQHGGGVIGV